MSMPSQRELFHHRCQEITRRGERQVVSLANVTWKEESTKLPDDRGERIEFSFLEGSLAFKRGDESLGSILKPWQNRVLQLSVSPGKRPHAQWLPSGPPIHQRALAVSLAADLSVAWLCPAEPSIEGHWTPPPPRDKTAHFTQFNETIEAALQDGDYCVKTHFSFTQREPPGTERGDALSAKGVTKIRYAPGGLELVEALSKTVYFRFGREVGIDSFRLTRRSTPFSWS